MQVGIGHEESGQYGQAGEGAWRAAGSGASLAAGGRGWHANAQFYPLGGGAARNAGRRADAATVDRRLPGVEPAQISNPYYVCGRQFVRRPISRPCARS
ncbi:hypothetical protein A8D95_22800 [Burkholderia cenocepacia]|uniref:Uncharacterized protein n=1 Tax=Burkholderia cenocepacia TaxID=95486 RepID=A0A1V2WC82_9BURK|nr:hypothetical protein A8D83_34150 [Burkholderia cenocepacia]ONJ22837.1 hypothetical protein A8D90_29015 [Burkholderia cenocepacia]ONP38349.1 hypothetical protein A8D85_17090 [Burkholderia cenocepacia]ONP41304.1 hypothetical protein A8D86_17715 [Burkholderia cenocepacia]ONP42719.1 hypothetical protein A8D87_27930 [Burkholderia cenocepacia]